MASEQTVGAPRPELSAAKRALIEARLRGQVRSSGIVPRDHRDGAPLSFAQERLWFIDRLDRSGRALKDSDEWVRARIQDPLLGVTEGPPKPF